MRLLILGTGGMADQHAKHFASIDGVKVVAGVDVDEKRAKTFCAAHGIERSFTSLEKALEWGCFDSVANVTPDNVHYATTLTALHAKKHVFCEKPLSTDHGRALEMTETAEEAGLVAMVNLTYRNVAELQRARAIVQSGAIGAVKHVEASYLQSWLVSKAWGDWREQSKWLWRLSKKHGSNGVLGDIGIHILDFAVYGAATDIGRVFCRLKTFHKAEGDRIGEYDLDANDSFAMSVEFANGALGVIHASRFATGHLNDLKLCIFGDRGALEVHHSPKGSKLLTCMGADIENGVWSAASAPAVATNYQRFVEAVRADKTLDPSFRHAADLQKILDLAAATEEDRKERAIAG